MILALVAEVERLSSLQLREWVELKASIAAAYSSEFNCGKCLKKYQGRQDYDAMTAKMRKDKACEEVKAAPIHRMGQSLTFKTCPGNFVRPAVVRFLDAHAQYDKGVMPHAGGMMDQPAKLIEVFGVISSTQAEMREAQEKREQLAKKRGAFRG